jgi:ATP-dependent Clp protease adapter protein ClpS
VTFNVAVQLGDRGRAFTAIAKGCTVSETPKSAQEMTLKVEERMSAGHVGNRITELHGCRCASRARHCVAPRRRKRLAAAGVEPHLWGDRLYCYRSRRVPRIPVGPDLTDKGADDKDALYEVRIIDNDVNTYGEVMHVTMTALGISEDLAFAVAWEVDHAGSCVVAHAPYAEAQALASMIRTIGIEVQVNPIVAGTAAGH